MLNINLFIYLQLFTEVQDGQMDIGHSDSLSC